MKNKVYKLLVIILVGGAAGILGGQLFLPWLAGFSFFARYDWIRHSREGVTVINRTEQIFVTQDSALQNAIAKAQRSVVLVLAERTEKTVNKKVVALEAPEVVAESSGLIMSSDGLILTGEAVAQAEAQRIIVVFGGKRVEARIEKQDQISGLALLKINENNLPVLPFAERGPKLGEAIFLVGAVLAGNSMVTFVDVSYARQIEPALDAEFLSRDLSGSPIFNIKAEVSGVRLAVSANQAKIVDAEQMRDILK